MKKYHPKRLDAPLVENHPAESTQCASNVAAPITESLCNEPVRTTTNWWEMANFGNVVVLNNLLKAGFNINAKAGDGNTALHCAARAGQVTAVEFLLANDAEVNVENDKRQTPLFVSPMDGHSECAMMILRAGGSVSRFGPRFWETELGFADHMVRSGDVQLIEAVIQDEFPQLKWSRSIKAAGFANAAAKIGHIPILQSIIKSDPQAFEGKSGNTPIYYAVDRGHMAAVQMLLTPSGLSQDRRTVSFRKRSLLLRLAAKGGFLEILEMLLECDPTTINGCPTGAYSSRDTALHIAARHGHLNVVEALLSHGAAHDPCNRRGESPLLAAFWENKLDVVQALSQYDTSILEPQENCFRAVSLAKVAQRLLEKQILSIKAQGQKSGLLYQSKSLLYVASELGDLELAKLVLEHQDWSPKDTNKLYWFPWPLSVLDVARKKGHTEIVDLLLAHKAMTKAEIRQQKYPTQREPKPSQPTTEMDLDMDDREDAMLDSNSDLEEQPFSYIDEYISPHTNDSSLSPLDGPHPAATETQNWMSTVLTNHQTPQNQSLHLPAPTQSSVLPTYDFPYTY